MVEYSHFGTARFSLWSAFFQSSQLPTPLQIEDFRFKDTWIWYKVGKIDIPYDICSYVNQYLTQGISLYISVYEVKSVMQVKILQSKVCRLQHFRFTNAS